MRLIFAGTPAVAAVSLAALLDHPRHEVAAVLIRPEKPAGRGRRASMSPVAELARTHGIEVLAPPTLRDPRAQAALRALEPDCCPVVAYGGLIPPAALDIPAHGWINLHFSLLPAWRGAAPVQRAVLAGDDVTGASTFLIEAGLDTGPVFGVLTESVRARDTSGDLLQRLAVAGSQLLLATLDGIQDGILVPEPQPSDGVSLAPKISVEDARIDWSAPALRVDRLIRACTPEPGAWTTLGGTRIKIGPVRSAPDDPGRAALAPGQLLVGRSQVLVGTASEPVALHDIQPPGKRPMPATDWARGARLSESDRFA
jgi:methionyl-tRNA formyltransferase